MKKVMLLVLVLTLVAGTLALGGCQAKTPPTPTPAPKPTPTSTPTPKPPITLKYASSMPGTGSPNRAAEWWGNEVEKRSNGRVKFEFLWGGAVVKAGEELDAVRTGLIHVGLINTSVYPDKLPLICMQWPVLFCPPDQDIMVGVFNTMFNHPAMLNDAERYNTKYIFKTTVGSRDISSKEPIRTVSDLKGKKIGVTGVYYPKALATIGAVGVTLTSAERYMAMKTGVIDANLLPMEATYANKIHETGNYATWLGLGAELVGLTLVNRDIWNKLDPDIQKIMQETGQEAISWCAKYVTNQRDVAKREMANAGVTFYNFPFEENVKWANALPDYPAEWAKEMDAKGLPGTELMKLFLDTCKKLGHTFPREWMITK